MPKKKEFSKLLNNTIITSIIFVISLTNKFECLPLKLESITRWRAFLLSLNYIREFYLTRVLSKYLEKALNVINIHSETNEYSRSGGCEFSCKSDRWEKRDRNGGVLERTRTTSKWGLGLLTLRHVRGKAALRRFTNTRTSLCHVAH